MNFKGYVRDDGKVGVRNQVVIIAAQGAANVVATGIASLVDGVNVVTQPYGRGQIGPDDQQQTRTLAGTVINPNVHSAIIVAWEPKEAEKMYKKIREKSNKRVEVITIIGQGTLKAIEQGAKLALDMVLEASEQGTEEVPIKHLTLAVNCGGSDTTSGIVANPITGFVCDRLIDMGGIAIFGETAEIMGAEHILARKSSPVVGQKIIDSVKRFEDYVLSLGIDIRGNQPKPDNIAGGLTTVEEKALGNIAKAGTHAIKDVIDYAEIPNESGLYHMFSSPAGAESNTGFNASGAQIIIFTTGQGNPVGHALCPVIKITGNPHTAIASQDNIDIDFSSVLKGEKTIEEAGQELLAFMLRVASGRKTRSEILKHHEYAISRIGWTV